MTPKQKYRCKVVAFILLGAALTAFFILKAYQQNIEYFLTPTQVHQKSPEMKQRYTVAGLVKPSSHQRLSDGVTHQFVLTDCEYDVSVQYTGLLPDLFREGQAIIAKGTFDHTNTFSAQQVLAKHDENYIPAEAAQAAMQAKANKCNTIKGKIKI